MEKKLDKYLIYQIIDLIFEYNQVDENKKATITIYPHGLADVVFWKRRENDSDSYFDLIKAHDVAAEKEIILQKLTN